MLVHLSALCVGQLPRTTDCLVDGDGIRFSVSFIIRWGTRHDCQAVTCSMLPKLISPCHTGLSKAGMSAVFLAGPLSGAVPDFIHVRAVLT